MKATESNKSQLAAQKDDVIPLREQDYLEEHRVSYIELTCHNSKAQLTLSSTVFLKKSQKTLSLVSLSLFYWSLQKHIQLLTSL